MKDFDIFTTDLFPYLEGEELKGSTLTLTIRDIRQEKMQSHKGKEESKYVLYFRETSKGLVLNKTNAKRVAVLHGKKTGGWADKKITLYTEEVRAFGETHNALRVAVAIPSNGNGEMTLEKLLVNLNKVERIRGFYGPFSPIMDCRSKGAELPPPDDTEGWRQLFVDARDHAFEQLDKAVEDEKIPPGQIPMSESEAVSSMDEVEGDKEIPF
ncbi:hypothetical protein LCGC14_2312700 [marine sediment metagenome]|uniref:Uncharacterized protein n=2 Tax=marine sediment metagenome TaxID=412755 RepID=A0A0F9CK68_9ZZZZ